MMEISPWLVYWLMQLDSICKCIEITSVLGSILLVGLIVFRIVWKVDDYYASNVCLENTTNIFKILAIVVPITIMLNTFMPNTKTVAAMILIPPIVNNEQVQQIPDDILTFVRSVIKEYTFDNKEKK